jgi:type I restriction enzyme S subunit
MLALLEEKRAALVSHTVTRGLNPNIPMKPSGLDWLGDIPAYWEVKRLKHFARIGNGSTPNRDNPRYWEGGDYPWLNSSVVNSRKVEDASRYVTEEALTECHLPKISPPAVLVAITGQGKTRGKSAVLELEATINQHLAFIKPEQDAVDCLYLSLLLDTAYSFIRSDSESAGSTRGAITCEQLSNFYITLPPREEQSEILSFAKEQISTIGSVEETLRRSILLLKERRSALITAAVTGQLALEMVST